MLLVLVAIAGPPPADPALARLSWQLRGPALGEVDTYRSRTPEPLDPDLVTVVVEGVDGTHLARAGFAVEAEVVGRVQVRVPYSRLVELAGIEGVVRVREPWRARPKETLTEGYAPTMVNDWHDEGVTGEGASIGIVDVGFVGVDELGTEGPAGFVSDFSRGDWTVTGHGTAVVEILFDFAPHADYRLASFSTDVELAEILEVFADEEVDVINASIGFDNVWHADGTSSLTLTADEAVKDGMAYFAAAGNENDKYRVGALTYANGTDIAIDGEVGTWVLTSGGFAEVSFRWSEPFGGAGQDIDLILLNDDGTECARSEDYQLGEAWPYEHALGSGCSEWVEAIVYSPDGVALVGGLEGYLYGYDGIDEGSWTWREDLTLPGDTVDGISVGAYHPDDDTAAYYSSRGPTNDGRLKPDVVAPTGVTTVTYGRGRFEGSSAATPHAAGLGALWISATNGHGRPEKLKDWMLEDARDLGDAGADSTFGAGAIRAREIPPRFLCGCGATPSAGWAWLGAAALLWRRHR